MGMFNILFTIITHLTPLPSLAAAAGIEAFEPGDQPCSAMDDDQAACSSEYCCTSCRYVGGVWTCWGCEAGNQCAGDVFSCVGCYTGGTSCSAGGASNSCCD